MEEAFGVSQLEWYDPRLTRKERARLINRAYRELRRQKRKVEGVGGSLSAIDKLHQSQNSTTESSSEEVEEIIVQE